MLHTVVLGAQPSDVERLAVVVVVSLGLGSPAYLAGAAHQTPIPNRVTDRIARLGAIGIARGVLSLELLRPLRVLRCPQLHEELALRMRPVISRAIRCPNEIWVASGHKRFPLLHGQRLVALPRDFAPSALLA